MTNFLDKLKKGMNVKDIKEDEEKSPAIPTVPLGPKEVDKEELEEEIKEESEGEIKTAGVKDFVLSNIKEVDKKPKKQKKTEPKKIFDPKKFFSNEDKNWLEPEGQLVIDVYETDNEIVIQSAIAGISPENLDISIEKDMVSIKGKREKIFEKKEKNYFIEECYWGAFSREIILPSEVDAEKAEASMKNGVLTIRAPKIEREKKKLTIK